MAKLNPKKVAERRKTLAEQLTNEVVEKGVVLFQPTTIENGNLNIDNDYLVLPHDLTEVESKELGKYLNALTQQKAYMRTLYSWQEINVEEAKRQYYDKYIVVYRDITESNPKGSEKSKELLCNNHHHVHPFYLTLRDNEMKLNMIGSTIESISECVFSISREISRRGADWNEYQRLDNLR